MQPAKIKNYLNVAKFKLSGTFKFPSCTINLKSTCFKKKFDNQLILQFY